MTAKLVPAPLVRLALVATVGGLAGCGASASATPQTTMPVTRAHAAAYAQAVNLRARDVPGMTIETPGGEAPAPNRSDLEFARCYGGVSPALRVTKIHSPEFLGGRGAHSQLIESRVEMWPTPGLAARNAATFVGSRGRACAAQYREAFNDRHNGQHPGRLQYGRPTAITVANPLPGVSQSFLHTIDQPILRDGQLRLHIYHDIFTFLSGPAEIELEATGFSRPVPSATEERLLLLLLARAKERTL